MTSRKIYRYLGRNGILTTHILIEGANYIPLVELTADKGKVLTNGEKTVYAVVVEESDVNSWFEIADKTN